MRRHGDRNGETTSVATHVSLLKDASSVMLCLSKLLERVQGNQRQKQWNLLRSTSLKFLALQVDGDGRITFHWTCSYKKCVFIPCFTWCLHFRGSCLSHRVLKEYLFFTYSLLILFTRSISHVKILKIQLKFCNFFAAKSLFVHFLLSFSVFLWNFLESPLYSFLKLGRVTWKWFDSQRWSVV